MDLNLDTSFAAYCFRTWRAAKPNEHRPCRMGDLNPVDHFNNQKRLILCLQTDLSLVGQTDSPAPKLSSLVESVLLKSSWKKINRAVFLIILTLRKLHVTFKDSMNTCFVILRMKIFKTYFKSHSDWFSDRVNLILIHYKEPIHKSCFEPVFWTLLQILGENIVTFHKLHRL